MGIDYPSMAVNGVTTSVAETGTKTSGDVPTDREYEVSADEKLDQALEDAIEAAEQADADQLASEFREQLGFFYAVRGN